MKLKKNILYYILIVFLGYFIYKKWQEREDFLAPAPLSMYGRHEYCFESVEKGRPGCTSLISENGIYKLVIQPTQMVLIYKPENKVYWYENLKKKGNKVNVEPYRLVMQEDGNLVVYDNTNIALWNSNTHTKKSMRKNPYLCHLNTDGNLMIKDKDNKIIWQTGNFYDRTRPTTPRLKRPMPIQTRLIQQVNKSNKRSSS